MLNLRRNRQKGFTLIELLIVVAIIGIIAAILIPNLLDALQKAKQKRTVSDGRNTGTAWMSWLTDIVGAASAGAAKEYKTTDLAFKKYSEVVKFLRPSDDFFYMQEVPQFDGWDGPLKFYLNSVNQLGARVMAIAAPARDNEFDYWVDPVVILPFISTDYNQDIIWADGYFLRWPSGTKR